MGDGNKFYLKNRSVTKAAERKERRKRRFFMRYDSERNVATGINSNAGAGKHVSKQSKKFQRHVRTQRKRYCKMCDGFFPREPPENLLKKAAQRLRKYWRNLKRRQKLRKEAFWNHRRKVFEDNRKNGQRKKSRWWTKAAQKGRVDRKRSTKHLEAEKMRTPQLFGDFLSGVLGWTREKIKVH